MSTALISLIEYGERHNENRATVRQKAKAGGFTTARKIGRNWVIDEDPEEPDEWEIIAERFDSSWEAEDAIKKMYDNGNWQINYL